MDMTRGWYTDDISATYLLTGAIST